MRPSLVYAYSMYMYMYMYILFVWKMMVKIYLIYCLLLVIHKCMYVKTSSNYEVGYRDGVKG